MSVNISSLRAHGVALRAILFQLLGECGWERWDCSTEGVCRIGTVVAWITEHDERDD